MDMIKKPNTEENMESKKMTSQGQPHAQPNLPRRGEGWGKVVE